MLNMLNMLNIILNKNILLFLMLISYIIPIIYIKLYFNDHESISHIISGKSCVLIPMICMCFFTILYEILRNNILSLILIICLIIGIIGVICINIDKELHFVYAYIAFISILFFMIMHTLYLKYNILYFLLYINIFIVDYIVNNINNNIFYHEIIYLFVFGIFYIILHFITS
jgi:hypothetical protein